MTTDRTGGDYDEALPLLESFRLTSSRFVFASLFLFSYAFSLGCFVPVSVVVHVVVVVVVY